MQVVPSVDEHPMSALQWACWAAHCIEHGGASAITSVQPTLFGPHGC